MTLCMLAIAFLLAAPNEPSSTGVSGQEMATPAPAFLGVRMVRDGERSSGGQVAGLIKGASAVKAGVLAGDIIIGINGERVSGPDAVTEFISKHRAGDSLSLKLLRDGKELDLTCLLIPRPLPSSLLTQKDPPRIGEGETLAGDEVIGGLRTGSNYVVTGPKTITGDVMLLWTCVFDVGIKRAEKAYIRASGDVELDGLFYAHIDGEKVQAGDKFEIISNAKSISGKFAETMLPKLDYGLAWKLEYDDLENGNDVDGDGKADVTLIVVMK